jgi:CDP-diacylglycerol--glycerol-3-phosphate 3-phosphatidyltransferase
VANSVTLLRILLIPVFLVVLLSNWPLMFRQSTILFELRPWVAAVVFILISATDAVDGYLARRRDEVSTFGKFIDPLADKLLVTAALIALVQTGTLPGWIALIIIAREFVISGLRMIASAEGVVIAASIWGKLKTTFQDIAIVAFIVKGYTTVLGIHATWPAVVLNVFAWTLMAVAVVLTVVSMVDYFRHARAVLRGPWSAPPDAQTPCCHTHPPADDTPHRHCEPAEATPHRHCEPAEATPHRHCEPAVATPHRHCEPAVGGRGNPALDLDLTRDIEALAAALTARGWTLACAESLTGGMLGAACTSVAGSSAWFAGSAVTYQTAEKTRVLGVDADTIARHGVVSRACVAQMAAGAQALYAADCAIAVSGVAGPATDADEAPVGTVWIAHATPDGTDAREYRFDGGREAIRTATVHAAIRQLFCYV